MHGVLGATRKPLQGCKVRQREVGQGWSPGYTGPYRLLKGLELLP